MVVQQAFIDRAEFLDVQGSVVDAARGAGGPLLVVGQVPEGLQEVTVGDGVAVYVQLLEELAVQGGGAEQAGVVLGAEYAPEHLQAAPEVVVVGVGAAVLQQPAEAGDAVVLSVERLAADEAALFGDEQEEEAVDQAQQLLVELQRGEAVGWRSVRAQPTAELVVGGMGQEAIRQALKAALDTIAQAFAHAPALLQRVLVVLLEEAFACVRRRVRQPRAVEQPVEEGELDEAALLEDLAEIELHVGLAADVGAVTQQP
ncbi:MAG: hypothetical protein NZ960_04840 [Candidatus Kapabacteria bacterium]|nr:hypothetical protein [Candidatus Kapabacteria bacterium]MDW8012024.1 hypothetical protein [Bacteroidota bacterium]